MNTLSIHNTFTSELSADPSLENTPRPVTEAAFSYVTPKIPTNPTLIAWEESVADSLGINLEHIHSESFTNYFSGKEVYPNTQPYAMCYGGHQFGHWAGQLGDGRAINLFEIFYKGKRNMVQLKGAGPTPYSRRADGLAVLRSSIREFLCSEAMFALGVPTTRALSLIATGDSVLRDMLYDGNAAYEPGAIVCRVAPTFIRFGNFQIFTARNDIQNLKKLLDYTIKHFYPELGEPNEDSYIAFYKAVAEKTLDMIIHWQRVGFVHGVMNTDNMSILGLTIDYGPYGWLDDYNIHWTPNTTDAQHKRYRFGNQPSIAQWNLSELAYAIYPLVQKPEPFQETLQHFKEQYDIRYLQMMLEKIGIFTHLESDMVLIQQLEKLLSYTETDMTLFFRLLANCTKTDSPADCLHIVRDAFYEPSEIQGEIVDLWSEWFTMYIARLQVCPETDEVKKTKMNLVNPKYVLRNYMAQLAIDEAHKGDYALVKELQTLLKNPYNEQPAYERWFTKRPDWARTKVGCSALSCSS